VAPPAVVSQVIYPFPCSASIAGLKSKFEETASANYTAGSVIATF
jgi:hypothetical protein